GQRMVEILKQKNGEPIPLNRQVVALYAATNKLFAGVPVARIREAEAQWIKFIDGGYGKIFDEIKKSGEIGEATKQQLLKAMTEFKSAHKELFVDAK
ncbi:MAG: F0F1 ATP synthase subunit alpha, partial [Minisyncoccia bacterium]